MFLLFVMSLEVRYYRVWHCHDRIQALDNRLWLRNIQVWIFTLWFYFFNYNIRSDWLTSFLNFVIILNFVWSSRIILLFDGYIFSKWPLLIKKNHNGNWEGISPVNDNFHLDLTRFTIWRKEWQVAWSLNNFFFKFFYISFRYYNRVENCLALALILSFGLMFLLFLLSFV